MWNTLLTVDLNHRETPYSPWACPTAEHPTHHGPAPQRNTLLTMDLPHHGKPFSLWTCPTAEQPTNYGPAPLWNTLLTMDLPHRRTPYSPWPHCKTPYSPWTGPHGTHNHYIKDVPVQRIIQFCISFTTKIPYIQHTAWTTHFKPVHKTKKWPSHSLE